MEKDYRLVLVGNTHVGLSWLKKSSEELKAVLLEILQP
jgi:hypothetical protein